VQSSQSNAQTTWKRKSGYIWSLLGSAIGFANVISFSAMCYRNGGGAFLIPFFLAMVILGWPMLCLEALIGQRFKVPLVTAYGKIFGNKAKPLGWIAIFSCITISGFYVVLTGYSIAYMGFSSVGSIGENTASFFQNDFLHLSPNIHTFGTLSWTALATTGVTLIVTAFVLFRGIQQGIEKICTIFLPLLTCLIVGFALGVAFLPGALSGWTAFLIPDFSHLTDIHLWRDVFGHLFFSFSLGLGIVVGYSRYTKSEMNVAAAMRYVAIGDLAISFVAGLAVFGCIGYMSEITGTPFHEIIRSDSSFEIGFVVFPALLKIFGPLFGKVFGVLFFFCVFIAGITGVFSIAEAILGNFETEFRMTRQSAILITLSLISFLSILFCMGNGLHLIDAVTPMVMGTNMLMSGIFQIAIFAWGNHTISSDPLWRQDAHSQISFWPLKHVAPVILVAILWGNVQADIQALDFPVFVRWAWFGIFFSQAIIFSRSPARKVELEYT